LYGRDAPVFFKNPLGPPISALNSDIRSWPMRPSPTGPPLPVSHKSTPAGSKFRPLSLGDTSREVFNALTVRSFEVIARFPPPPSPNPELGAPNPEPDSGPVSAVLNTRFAKHSVGEFRLRPGITTRLAAGFAAAICEGTAEALKTPVPPRMIYMTSTRLFRVPPEQGQLDATTPKNGPGPPVHHQKKNAPKMPRKRGAPAPPLRPGPPPATN
jgi:hypothetical protein